MSEGKGFSKNVFACLLFSILFSFSKRILFGSLFLRFFWWIRSWYVAVSFLVIFLDATFVRMNDFHSLSILLTCIVFMNVSTAPSQRLFLLRISQIEYLVVQELPHAIRLDHRHHIDPLLHCCTSCSLVHELIFLSFLFSFSRIQRSNTYHDIVFLFFATIFL